MSQDIYVINNKDSKDIDVQDDESVVVAKSNKIVMLQLSLHGEPRLAEHFITEYKCKDTPTHTPYPIPHTPTYTPTHVHVMMLSSLLDYSYVSCCPDFP